LDTYSLSKEMTGLASQQVDVPSIVARNFSKWTRKLDSIAAQMNEEEWSEPQVGWTVGESPSSNTDESNACWERNPSGCRLLP